MSEESSLGTSSGLLGRPERGSVSSESFPKIILPKLKTLQVSSVTRYCRVVEVRTYLISPSLNIPGVSGATTTRTVAAQHLQMTMWVVRSRLGAAEDGETRRRGRWITGRVLHSRSQIRAMLLVLLTPLVYAVKYKVQNGILKDSF